MKFSKMKYTRPDMDTLKAAADKAAAEIKSAVSADCRRTQDGSGRS